MKRTWAVIGGGNGGQTIAGHLALLGERVRLYDVVEATVEALNRRGGVTLHHALEGFGPLEFATTDMEKALCGAQNVMLTLPSIYHESVARRMIPFLRDGMTVFLHPESSCGAIAFRRLMQELGCTAEIVLGAACTLLYSTRVQEPGEVYVFGLKQEVPMAALPARDNERLAQAIRPALPWFTLCRDVLYTSLNNINAMMHPAPVLLSISRIEAEPFVPFEYYHEGLTPSIGTFVEQMDRERLAVAQALGLTIPGICEDYVKMYACGDEATPLYQLCRNNPGYEGVMSANTIATRYVLEDIPYSLEPIRALARVCGVETPCMDAVVTIGRAIFRERMDEGRTLTSLGLDGMTRQALLQLAAG